VRFSDQWLCVQANEPHAKGDSDLNVHYPIVPVHYGTLSSIMPAEPGARSDFLLFRIATEVVGILNNPNAGYQPFICNNYIANYPVPKEMKFLSLASVQFLHSLTR
jgi:hypothetical protein